MTIPPKLRDDQYTRMLMGIIEEEGKSSPGEQLYKRVLEGSDFLHRKTYPSWNTYESRE